MKHSLSHSREMMDVVEDGLEQFNSIYACNFLASRIPDIKLCCRFGNAAYSMADTHMMKLHAITAAVKQNE